MNRPLVSVIIPTYNRAGKIRGAVESVLNQTYPNVQLIVIDDGSNDGTAKVIAEYPSIEYFWKPNGGQASARNKGLSFAKGEYIASLDSDDVWEKEFLNRCVTKLEEEQLDFVFANWYQNSKEEETYDFINTYDPLKPYLKDRNETWINLTYAEARDVYINSCPSPSSSVVMRKSSMIKGWSDDMNIADDWCLLLNMILAKECKVAFTKEILWHKQVDTINVYDGRNELEVFRLLNIEDIGEFIRRFGTQLTKEELQILQKIHMEGLVEIAKHILCQERNISASFKLFKNSFKINPSYTFKKTNELFMESVERRFARLIGKRDY